MKLAVLAGIVAMGLGGFAIAEGDAHKDHQHGQKAATTQPAGKPVNTKCPVSGEDIDPAVTTTHEGKTIAFCCKDCIDAFKKDPAKYSSKLK